MHQSKVISPRVTTKDFVTTLFAHNLSATAVMLHLQVLEDNVDPEKNKTKHTYKIFIQTCTFSVNEPILIAALKVFPQPSRTHKIWNCVGDSYACTLLAMTWMTCHRCCTGESSCPDASRSCAWLTPSPGQCCASPKCPSSSPPHASPLPPPYRPGQTPPTQLPPGLTALVILLVEYLQSCIKSLPFRLLLTSSPSPSLIFSTLAKSDGEARQDDVGEAEEMQQRAGV